MAVDYLQKRAPITLLSGLYSIKNGSENNKKKHKKTHKNIKDK